MCLYGSKMLLWERKRSPSPPCFLFRIMAQEWQAQEGQGCEGLKVLEVSLEFLFLWCDARKLGYTYPAKCHTNVLLPIYGKVAPDPLLGKNLFLKLFMYKVCWATSTAFWVLCEQWHSLQMWPRLQVPFAWPVQMAWLRVMLGLVCGQELIRRKDWEWMGPCLMKLPQRKSLWSMYLCARGSSSRFALIPW